MRTEADYLFSLAFGCGLGMGAVMGATLGVVFAAGLGSAFVICALIAEQFRG